MPINETFHGFVETTTDALLLFEACRRGLLPKISRRLQERERYIIRSGSVFIFDEKESGIKRWTDGRAWSPSRILGNFLIYRELDNKETLHHKHHHPSPYEPYPSRHYYSEQAAEQERQRDKNLIGSLTDTYKFLPNGLIKKTISIHLHGYTQHLISYYSKTDVIHAKLNTPSSTAELSSLQIMPDLLLRQSFRVPPSVEFAELMLRGPKYEYSSRRPSFEFNSRNAGSNKNFNMPPLSIITETIFHKNKSEEDYYNNNTRFSLPSPASMIWSKSPPQNHYQQLPPQTSSAYNKPYNDYEHAFT